MFGEALGSLYADKYGMQVFCMRIGNVNPAPIDKRRLSIWFSPRDLAQLVTIGIEHPDIRFEIVYGISGNTARLVRQLQRRSASATGRRTTPRPTPRRSCAQEKPGGDPRRRDAPGRRLLRRAKTIPNPAPLPKKQPPRRSET